MTPLKAMLLQDEGLELKPYLDSRQKLTIGVGRNLEDVGISSDEAMYLLDKDILRAMAAAATFQWFSELDVVRKDVVVAMIFNMGLTKFCEFKQMIHAFELKDYPTAGLEALNSRWAVEVGKRAVRLAGMMRTGLYPQE